MKRKELITFLIACIVIYILYHIITTNLLMNTPAINSDTLINTTSVHPQKLYHSTWNIVKHSYIDSTCNNQDWKRWKHKYDGKIQTDEDAKVAIDTMLASLNDQYSRFLSKKEYLEQANSIDSHITGIGINIMSKSGTIIVHSTLENTPAKKAGILSNDIILCVNGKNISGMDISNVANIIRGPINTYVTLKIKRKNKIIIKKLKREKIEIKLVESSVRKNNIGYIKINSFIGSNTASDFIKETDKLKNTKGLIIDLRGNTGGLLTNAVVVANMFIKDGNIVHIVSKNDKKREINAISNQFTINKPTVILIDRTTASASEILSGALKDNKKAVLIGEKSFGKGLVQQIIPLSNQTGINITVAKYLTPNGNDINKKGIEPNIKIPYKLSDLKKNKDAQLLKAETVINQLCKQ